MLCEPFEVYSALAILQEDGYLGSRCLLSDALISWSAESAMEILGKHITKLPADAQRRLENQARSDLERKIFWPWMTNSIKLPNG